MHLQAVYTADVAAERFSLSDKCNMFEDVFGYKVILS